MNLKKADYQEQASLIIETAHYTAIYHKEGCGLAALLDRDGNDWIGYRPSGGEYGNYRGIPNMGMNVFGHPGYSHGATTEVVSVHDRCIRLASTSADGAWQTAWDFFPARMVQAITAVAAPYWWLYEGTPGGYFQPERQYLLLPDGSKHSCSDRYAAPMAEARTVCFVDPTVGRGLQLSAHTPEPTVDLYWPMGGDGGMTVWGFGRHDDDNGPHSHLQAVPASFSVAFVEEIPVEERAP